MNPHRTIALIPARAGSKRVPGKNIRTLRGHPLLAYTIAAAIESKIFARVIVSTESEEVAAIARRYGAEVPFLRPVEFAGDRSPDIEWVRYTLERLVGDGEVCEAFALLRPTSPFRRAETIRRAWDTFSSTTGADSLRAVEPCSQHPGKMWVVEGEYMVPLLNDGSANPPWHSTPYQALPRVYAQNASLEMAWTQVPLKRGSIAGTKVVPFFTQGLEGFDINVTEDWMIAELYLANGEAVLPEIHPST